MEIRYWAGTDVGRKRAGNEDNFLIDKQLKLFVVADGMGGHASGEIASAMAVHGIRQIVASERDLLEAYDDEDPRSHVEVCTMLEYAVHATCEHIYRKARQEPEKRGMGTTLVAMLIIGARGFIAYVGDSRIYLLRGGVVYQLTEDHSLRNELIRMGKITAEEFEGSPYASLKNAMTRAVGVYEHVEVDTLDFDIIPGDSFLLCSDGLYEYLDDHDIASTLGLPEIKEVPGQLIDMANTRGGKDNITAIAVQVATDGDDAGRAEELNLTIDMLKQVPIFEALSYQQLVRILNLAKLRNLTIGEEIFGEGDEGDELYVVIKGRIELTRGGVVIAHLAEGAHLGEMALIDASPRSTAATAVQQGRLLALHRDDFYQILRREPPLAVKLLLSFLQILATRLRKTTAALADARIHTNPRAKLPAAPDTADEDEDEDEDEDDLRTTARRRTTAAATAKEIEAAEASSEVIEAASEEVEEVDAAELEEVEGVEEVDEVEEVDAAELEELPAEAEASPDAPPAAAAPPPTSDTESKASDTAPPQAPVRSGATQAAKTVDPAPGSDPSGDAREA